MVVVQVPGDELGRLQIVKQLTNLPFQALANRLQPLSRLLAQICETPCAQISLVDQGSVHIVSAFGDVPKEIPRNRSVSAHTILMDEALVSLGFTVNLILELALSENDLTLSQATLEEELRQAKKSLQGLEILLRDATSGSQSRRS